MKTQCVIAIATCCFAGLLVVTATAYPEVTSDAKTGAAPQTYPPNSKSNPLVPTFADVAYGEHERNKLDFWQAKSETPTPVIMIIHGGGWIAGSKANVSRSPRFPNLRAILGQGISVVAINYRLIGKHSEGVTPPVKAPLHDAARALQFVRSKARQWNINKERIGAYGPSAGGCSSLWLAYHDDMADPKSEDPVARESTRLWSAAGSGAQTTLDPVQLKEWFTNPGYGGHAFGNYAYGKDFEKFLADREKLLPWIAEYSPFALVSAGDPPVYLSYGDRPPASGVGSDSVHGVTFGVCLQKRCNELEVECHVVYPGAPALKYKSPIEYLIATLKAPADPNDSAQGAASGRVPHESRPTLKFTGSTPATEAIEDAFTMALDNLIGINSIPYDPKKWNDTGLLETGADSRFLRAAPSYGENPWVHDGAYNTWSAMNLLEANDGRSTHVARNTLWACCDVVDGKLVVNIRQSAHSEWYMYQLWNIAAWHYYRVTGDAAFLAKAYEAATQVLAKQEANHFNKKYGLFEGSYFVGDGASGFPQPPFEPGRRSSNALNYAEVHKAMVLSTNCVYVGAYRATAAMGEELKKPPSEIAGLTAKADSIAAKINQHMWIPKKGRYGFFIHGTGTQKAGTLDPTQEGGGISFAILFGVADAAKTKTIFENVHRQPKGITMSWPHFTRFSDEQPGRHNVSVWPQINGLFAHAACIGGRIDLFQSEVENMAGLFRGSGNIREIYHHLSGEHCGGFQMNSSGKISPWQAVGNQAWGAGAFSRMIYYGMFGMNFETGGIRFAPTLPAAWGEVRLGDLQYRDMKLNITLKGSGNVIRGFQINGRPCIKPYVPGHLSGIQNITILLDDRKRNEQAESL